MAENADGAERSEEPTGKRLQKARSEGQIARSKELPAAAELVVMLALFVFFGGWFFFQLADLFGAGFVLDKRTLDSPNLLPVMLAKEAFYMFLIFVPFFAVSIVVAIASSTATGGFNFTWKGLEPKFNKLNPITGMKRFISLNALVELSKALLKFGLVASTLYFTIALQIDDFMMLGSMPLKPALVKSGELIAISSLIVAASLIIIALIDVPYQKHSYNEKMKMTKQEVKEEMKDMEGNPQVKRKIRQRQMEMAAGRMLEKVKDADVVVTNPEHFSVALAYDPNSDGAPIVVAMGVDHLAFRIREEAKNHGVTIFPAPPLARALYYTSEVDQPIHHDLYIAVAQVIAYVFNLNSTNSDGSLPAKPDPSVPESMKFDALGRKAATQ